MADFAPPPGPPPPVVPQGWKAVWNAQYSEWFFVNIYTKKSQWEKPTEPSYPPGEGPPDGPPPYSGAGHDAHSSLDKKNLGTNNPYGSTGGTSPNPNMSEDEKLARRLQEEEEARSHGSRGAANDFYQQQPQGNAYGGASGAYGGSSSPYPQQSQSPYAGGSSAPVQEKKKGLFGSLLGGHSSKPTYQNQGYQNQGYPPQQAGYGGYGQQPGYGQGGYGGYPQQQQGMYGRPQKKAGMGAMGAGALGLGGGLLAGGLIGEAMGDAGDGGGDGGGDYGGGDGGGDYGGGDGGGDFGGGDF